MSQDLRELTKGVGTGPIPVDTAFLVIRHQDGRIQVTPDINVPIVPDRPASTDEVTSLCHRVEADLHAQKVAGLVQAGMMQAAAAAREAADTQKLITSLKI